MSFGNVALLGCAVLAYGLAAAAQRAESASVRLRARRLHPPADGLEVELRHVVARRPVRPCDQLLPAHRAAELVLDHDRAHLHGRLLIAPFRRLRRKADEQDGSECRQQGGCRVFMGMTPIL